MVGEKKLKGNILCLGCSYPDVPAQLRAQGTSVRALEHKTLCLDQVIECVSHGLMEEIDARDLARCLAMENKHNVRAYTVSIEKGCVYDRKRHLDCDFNTRLFVPQLRRLFGRNKKFTQIILDYFWLPKGGWSDTHWTYNFFSKTLPQLGSTALEEPGTIEGSKLQSGCIYLPFTLHCISMTIACLDIYTPLFNISFVRTKDLEEHALWSGTKDIDPKTMQTILAKRKDQETLSCGFSLTAVKEAMDNQHVTKEKIRDILSRIKDFKSITFIRLQKKQEGQKGGFTDLKKIDQNGAALKTEMVESESKIVDCVPSNDNLQIGLPFFGVDFDDEDIKTVISVDRNPCGELMKIMHSYSKLGDDRIGKVNSSPIDTSSTKQGCPSAPQEKSSSMKDDLKDGRVVEATSHSDVPGKTKVETSAATKEEVQGQKAGSKTCSAEVPSPNEVRRNTASSELSGSANLNTTREEASLKDGNALEPLPLSGVSDKLNTEASMLTTSESQKQEEEDANANEIQFICSQMRDFNSLDGSGDDFLNHGPASKMSVDKVIRNAIFGDKNSCEKELAPFFDFVSGEKFTQVEAEDGNDNHSDVRSQRKGLSLGRLLQGPLVESDNEDDFDTYGILKRPGTLPSRGEERKLEVYREDSRIVQKSRRDRSRCFPRMVEMKQMMDHDEMSVLTENYGNKEFDNGRVLQPKRRDVKRSLEAGFPMVYSRCEVMYHDIPETAAHRRFLSEKKRMRKRPRKESSGSDFGRRRRMGASRDWRSDGAIYVVTETATPYYYRRQERWEGCAGQMPPSDYAHNKRRRHRDRPLSVEHWYPPIGSEYHGREIRERVESSCSAKQADWETLDSKFDHSFDDDDDDDIVGGAEDESQTMYNSQYSRGSKQERVDAHRSFRKLR